MEDIVILEWSFSPNDFFEEPVEIFHRDQRMTIDKGKVEARIDPEIFDETPAIGGELEQLLCYHFLGVVLATHKSYQLSGPMVRRVHPDGREGVIVSLGGSALMSDVGGVSILMQDTNGNVTYDSQKARVREKHELARRVANCCSRDRVAARLLDSYRAAVDDPENELVHLYEIRDALAAHFGGADAAQVKLGISGTQWAQFGRLANNEPVKEGRHRGKSANVALRDSTPAELTQARCFARTLIDKYLRYLSESSQVVPNPRP